MPDAAEIDPLVLALGHFDDLGILGKTGNEGIARESAEVAREGNELCRRQILITKEDDEMIEQRATDLGDRGSTEIAGEIDIADFGADRARDRLDLHCRAAGPSAPRPRP